jgi:hypothetical protein
MAFPSIRDSGIVLSISQAGTSNFWVYTQDLLQNFIKPVESEDVKFSDLAGRVRCGQPIVIFLFC